MSARPEASRLDVEDFDAVVSDIYEASLCPSRWTDALLSLIQRFGGEWPDVAMLLWERTAPPAGRFLGSAGVSQMAREGYLHAFAGRNEWSVRGRRMPVGAVFHSDALIDPAEFRRTNFYRDYLAHFRFDVGVLALVDRSREDHLCLCLPGRSTADPRRLESALRLLMPHLQRAVRISRRLGEAELSAASSKAVLDRAPSAILICEAGLRLTYCNAAAEELMAQGYLRRLGDQLILPGQSAALVERLLRPDARGRCAALTLDAHDEPPLGAMALRLDRNDPVNPIFGRPQLMIVAGQRDRASDGLIEALRRWYGLTPAEARLAAALAVGGALEDFAAVRGVSLNAARFLLKGVFAKTGCRRQAELVARLQEQPIHWRVAYDAPELPPPLDPPELAAVPYLNG